jgi:TonB family protein
VDLGRLASSPRHEEFLRRNLVTPIPRWRWRPPSHIGRPLRVAGEVEAPRKVYAPQPQYTLSARSAGVQGVVILQSVIGSDGRIHRLRLLRGLPHGLSEVAAATVCTWRFEPATLDGEPVEVYYNLTVNFTLSPL